MSIEFLLIAVLAICILVLTVLLIQRISREKNQSKVVQSLYKDTLASFLNKNSSEGSLVEVARQFSNILKDAFGCHHIIFLRKKRGALELNFYHNIRKFNRSDFNLDVNRTFLKTLMSDFFPRDISQIEEFLTPTFTEKLKMFQMDRFFPIYWRENLYGLYIIKSNRYTESETFRLLLAQLAQSLSSAYHIKWHESKLDTFKEKSKSNTQIRVTSVENKYPAKKMLNLLKHKKLDSIVPKLLELLSETSELSNLSLVYQANGEDESIRLVQKDHTHSLAKPLLKDFQNLVNEIKAEDYTSIDEIEKKFEGSSAFLNELKKSGYSYLTSIPMPENKIGLLSWKDEKQPDVVLKQFDRVKDYMVELMENAYEYEKVEELSYKDNLTGLFNQRFFNKRLEEEISRAGRYSRQLALIILDIDELKFINDSYGHQAGDEIIQQVGTALKKSIRTIDVISRYGGDEFCIIMPEADRKMCAKFMERLHSKINNLTFSICNAKIERNCTISMGAAVYPEHAEDSKNLIYAADMALLEAKESGRNTSILSSKTYLS